MIMAKINAEYDTKTKKLAVTKDGEALANVHYVEFGRSYDQPDDTSDEDTKHICRIGMKEKSDDGYVTHHHIMANKQGELETVKEPNNSLADFIKKNLLDPRRGK
jgi:hypothetical protein